MRLIAFDRLLEGGKKIKFGYPFRPNIFVSYARKDKQHLASLAKRLDELEQQGAAVIFIDYHLKPGDVWRRRILSALGQFDIAVVLISPDFLASRFVQQVELPLIRHAAKRYRAKILPVFLAECELDAHKWLLEHQLPTTDRQPLLEAKLSRRAEILDGVIDGIKVFAVSETRLRRFLRRNIWNWRFSISFVSAIALIMTTTFLLGWRYVQHPLVKSVAWSVPLSQCRAEALGSSVQLFENGWMVARFETDEYLAIVKTGQDGVRWQRFDTAGFTKGVASICPEDESSELLRLGFRWRYCHTQSAGLRTLLGKPLADETRAWMEYQDWAEGVLVYGLPSTRQGIETVHFQKLSGAMLRRYSKLSGNGTMFGFSGMTTEGSVYCTAKWYPARKDVQRTELHARTTGKTKICPRAVDPVHYTKPRARCSISGY